jgi:hypothetical protein
MQRLDSSMGKHLVVSSSPAHVLPLSPPVVYILTNSHGSIITFVGVIALLLMYTPHHGQRI